MKRSPLALLVAGALLTGGAWGVGTAYADHRDAPREGGRADVAVDSQYAIWWKRRVDQGNGTDEARCLIGDERRDQGSHRGADQNGRLCDALAEKPHHCGGVCRDGRGSAPLLAICRSREDLL